MNKYSQAVCRQLGANALAVTTLSCCAPWWTKKWIIAALKTPRSTFKAGGFASVYHSRTKTMRESRATTIHHHCWVKGNRAYATQLSRTHLCCCLPTEPGLSADFML